MNTIQLVILWYGTVGTVIYLVFERIRLEDERSAPLLLRIGLPVIAIALFVGITTYTLREHPSANKRLLGRILLGTLLLGVLIWAMALLVPEWKEKASSRRSEQMTQKIDNALAHISIKTGENGTIVINNPTSFYLKGIKIRVEYLLRSYAKGKEQEPEFMQHWDYSCNEVGPHQQKRVVVEFESNADRQELIALSSELQRRKILIKRISATIGEVIDLNTSGMYKYDHRLYREVVY